VASIHPLALVDPKAELAADVVVGPFCNIEAGVVIGEGCRLDSHCTIKTGTVLGARNVVAQGAVLGGDPQDRKYHGEPTYLRIGDDNVIREYVTLHRATGEGLTTTIGNRGYYMAFVHVGHNSTIHDDVTIANSTNIGGHCTVEPYVVIGAMVGVHQYVRIGKAAMIQGAAGLNRDAPPFMISAGGPPAEVVDINAVGLRRLGVGQEARTCLHRAVKLLFRTKVGLRNGIDLVRQEVQTTEEVEYLLAFMERLYHGKHGRGDQP
jgi:UDP-N-acetylglucosamine acyltransferase